MNIYVIVGCGGTGSNLAPMLARMQEESDVMFLIDGDVVAPSNVERQAYQNFDIGENKARALSKKLNCCYGTEHYAVDTYLQFPEHLIDILKPALDSSYTRWWNKVFIIGCVDTNKARLILENSFKMCIEKLSTISKFYYIDSGNEDTYGTVLVSSEENMNLRSKLFDMEDVQKNVHCDVEIADLNPQQYQINLDMALAITKVVYAIVETEKHPAVIKINGFERSCIFSEES